MSSLKFSTLDESKNTISIIVTFNPEREKLKRLIEATLPQVARILLIDNGSKSANVDWINSFFENDFVELHPLGENLGIATAQNIGINIARERGAAYILLFDHDSLPAIDMVEKLFVALRIKELQGISVGAVGPNYDDVRFKGRVYPFIEAKGMRLIIKDNHGPEEIVPVSWLIASGSLIPMSVLDDVGVMLDDLFIDYVDIEWGLRANQKGYQIFGVRDAYMEHNLGENPTTIFGKVFCFHSPVRHYYQFRNPIALYVDSGYALSWKIGDAYRLMTRFIFYAIFVKPHLKHIKMMVKGIVDGISRRMGKIGN